MNWQRSSSRRKVATLTMSRVVAVMVSSPCATQWPTTEPASAPAMVSPSACPEQSQSIDASSIMLVQRLDRSGAADFFLQQQHAVEQRLGGRRTARHVDVDRHDAVAAAHHRIGIVVVAAAVGARSHRDDVARLRHLVVDLAQRRRHLVGQRAGDDHHVGLARTRRAAQSRSARRHSAASTSASSRPRSRRGRTSSTSASRCAPR